MSSSWSGLGAVTESWTTTTSTTQTWSDIVTTAERFVRPRPFEDGIGGIDFVMRVQNNPAWQVRTTQPWEIRTLSSITADTSIEGQP